MKEAAGTIKDAVVAAKAACQVRLSAIRAIKEKWLMNMNGTANPSQASGRLASWNLAP